MTFCKTSGTVMFTMVTMVTPPRPPYILYGVVFTLGVVLVFMLNSPCLTLSFHSLVHCLSFYSFWLFLVVFSLKTVCTCIQLSGFHDGYYRHVSTEETGTSLTSMPVDSWYIRGIFLQIRIIKQYICIQKYILEP